MRRPYIVHRVHSVHVVHCVHPGMRRHAPFAVISCPHTGQAGNHRCRSPSHAENEDRGHAGARQQQLHRTDEDGPRRPGRGPAELLPRHAQAAPGVREPHPPDQQEVPAAHPHHAGPRGLPHPHRALRRREDPRPEEPFHRLADERHAGPGRQDHSLRLHGRPDAGSSPAR